MKMKGGYLPKITGRPASLLKKASLAPFLKIDLLRNNLIYKPVVNEGQIVKSGDILAEARISETRVYYLPSPVDSSVQLLSDPDSSEVLSIRLNEINPSINTNPDLMKNPGRLTPEETQKILMENGIWDYFWSSGSFGIPEDISVKKPKSIIINSIISEPFRARGKVILKHFWHNIIKGMTFLNTLLDDYGTIEFILTEKRDPVVKMMLKDLLGKTNLKFHYVEVKYPVENTTILNGLLRDDKTGLNREDEIWLLNIQSVEAIGNCLGNGIPLNRRIVALGGPAFPDPKHVNALIGTPLKTLIPDTLDLTSTIILRGGLFLGEIVDPETVSIGFDDDSFFFLPVKEVRDFITFLKPGFNKKSIFPNFAGRIDRDLSNQLRGEERPCIACCKCQEVCPANLMPQIIHRYLYRDNLDEAQELGLDNCISCNLCTYVCPSKIELEIQFTEAKRKLRLEQEGIV
jgi:Na(+)-translocating NADH:ubiquinone oxidoreductase A subunit